MGEGGAWEVLHCSKVSFCTFVNCVCHKRKDFCILFLKCVHIPFFCMCVTNENCAMMGDKKDREFFKVISAFELQGKRLQFLAV